MTPQRLAVLEFLEGNKSHPSAFEVYEAVKKRFPTVSFATVYNILEVFKDKGIVRELKIDPERRRFDPDTAVHHHFLCISCGKVTDLVFEMRLSEFKKALKGFDVRSYELNLYGLCPECKVKKSVGVAGK